MWCGLIRPTRVVCMGSSYITLKRRIFDRICGIPMATMIINKRDFNGVNGVTIVTFRQTKRQTDR